LASTRRRIFHNISELDFSRAVGIPSAQLSGRAVAYSLSEIFSAPDLRKARELAH
jgi:hypothetical protein